MTTKEILRHIAGYIVGIALFFMAIPWALYAIAIKCDSRVLGELMPNLVRVPISIVFAAIGVVFVLWSNAALFFIGKGGPTDGLGIAISPRTKHLVVVGPYRYTRNPMVFGALCCYIALGIYVNSAVVVAIVISMTPLMMLYLKKTEEKRLLRDFGDEFLEYKKSVPMILPKIIIKRKN